MKALYDIGGHMVALNRIVVIGPVETISPFQDDKVFLFEIILAGAAHPHRFPCKDLGALEKYRADLIGAFDQFHKPDTPPQGNAPGPLEIKGDYPGIGTITLGEVCLIRRYRAGLSLAEAGAAAWPDLKAANQKLKKIESGIQAPSVEDLERLAEVLGAPELVGFGTK